mmetsp:Transcript_13914/g.30208  ORF Transcript_13914/g.30208 Transcript_13914/m.30208 type:complete len:282 (+) Transcript_13914:486-1331(+)|eukprot:CAMPEP_0172534724 /NCGR_PEP_ID=MMETSP1067-20121228/6979_1 /TAXON_ID=265564 ORGANISM="Thalassiosira punctigera, Strain Tpunct2005C2" /NCGR_SAMPLE_ID=MMETSP1067 /ASSEMBLY_ACC=CAM_ASM_000444 /LENGTH=281 /DNA_ID=CAMNT_0013319547 /DNA_START=365 /DNA_END=1210 /DNA_ORIENTATION=-
MVAKMNHYEVLEVSKDAELIDIKKAYRRLALKHHPDRNGGSAESTEKFKEISTAYTILSDASKRRDYNYSRTPPAAASASTATGAASSPSNPASPSRQGSAAAQGEQDAFQQFDDLFRNDPFFHDAFQDMDDVFAQRFDSSEDQKRDDSDTSDNKNTTQWDSVGSLFMCGMERPQAAAQKPKKAKQVPWSEWIMNKLGIELSVTSISHKPDGSVEASAYTSKPFGTYSKKKHRTYVENGEQVSVMSMEKDGNMIEDKFIGGKMVERKVNGKIEELPKQVAN